MLADQTTNSSGHDASGAVFSMDDPDVFGQKRIHYTHSVEESKQLNDMKDPCVIIAASGM